MGISIKNILSLAAFVAVPLSGGTYVPICDPGIFIRIPPISPPPPPPLPAPPAPGFVGALSTVPEVKDGVWYKSIRKPFFNPPNWIFGPVWSTLYTTLGTAAWLAWKKAGHRFPLPAFGLYGANLALNFVWSPLFFKFHELGWSSLVVTGITGTALSTARAFHAITPRAGWLLAPYCAWVSFATVLNVTIWRMNAGLPINGEPTKLD